MIRYILACTLVLGMLPAVAAAQPVREPVAVVPRQPTTQPAPSTDRRPRRNPKSYHCQRYRTIAVVGGSIGGYLLGNMIYGIYSHRDGTQPPPAIAREKTRWLIGGAVVGLIAGIAQSQRIECSDRIVARDSIMQLRDRPQAVGR